MTPVSSSRTRSTRWPCTTGAPGSTAEPASSIEHLLASIQGPFRVVPGKLVFDVMPVDAPHKGAALIRLIDADAVEAAIYVGDDATDEDVFRLSDSERLLTIRIGRHRRSAAQYFIRDQRDVDLFLDEVSKVQTTVAGS